MTQTQITKKTKLLDDKGHLAAKGYATTNLIEYNRKRVRKNPFNLKEWNFYQFACGNHVLQMTIGHVSYATNVSVTLMDVSNGKKWTIDKMRFFAPVKLDLDAQSPSFNIFQTKDFCMTFEVDETRRILRFNGKNKQYKKVQVQLFVENDVQNEKMIIATPFDKKHQFYFNYKENYYKATGFVQFDDYKASFYGATGVLDWGRGIWPYKHEWFWGSVSSLLDGVPFGMNIGWGFGDLSHATENMIFYNKKAYKIGKLNVERDPSNYMSEWRLWDDDGNVQLLFTPQWDNYTQNKLVVVDTHCNQLFGKYEGYVRLDEQVIRFNSLNGFIEHAVNRW